MRSLRATGATWFKNIARPSSALCACQIGVLYGMCARSAAKPDTACDDTLTAHCFERGPASAIREAKPPSAAPSPVLSLISSFSQPSGVTDAAEAG